VAPFVERSGGVKRLAFKGRFVEGIVSGSKTTTLRRPSGHLPGVGEIVAFGCQYHRPPFAFAEVIEIRDVTLADLTDADALADGYPDADALRSAVVVMLARPSDQASLDVGLAHIEKLRLLRWRLRPDVLEAGGQPTH